MKKALVKLVCQKHLRKNNDKVHVRSLGPKSIKKNMGDYDRCSNRDL